MLAILLYKWRFCWLQIRKFQVGNVKAQNLPPIRMPNIRISWNAGQQKRRFWSSLSKGIWPGQWSSQRVALPTTTFERCSWRAKIGENSFSNISNQTFGKWQICHGNVKKWPRMPEMWRLQSWGRLMLHNTWTTKFAARCPSDHHFWEVLLEGENRGLHSDPDQDPVGLTLGQVDGHHLRSTCAPTDQSNLGMAIYKSLCEALCLKKIKDKKLQSLKTYIFWGKNSAY